MSTAVPDPTSAPRCQGWRRYGGAFSIGPPHWEQCSEAATVTLMVGERQWPSCATCWREALDKGIEIAYVEPL